MKAFPRRRPTGAPRPGVVLLFKPGVRADVRHEVRRLTDELRGACPPTHRVLVTVVPHPAVEGTTGVFGFGIFHCPVRGRGPRAVVRIAVAAGLADLVVRHRGETRAQAVRDVAETFLHEWVHYEQWRAGRRLTERGVKVRARNLYERFTPANPATARGVRRAG